MTKDEAEDGFVWAYKSVFNEAAVKSRAAHLKEIYKSLS
jgi:hypothetical protein